MEKKFSYGIFIIGNLGCIRKPQKSSTDYRLSPIFYTVFWKQLNLVKLEPKCRGLILETHMAAKYHVMLQHGWVGEIMWDICNTGRYFFNCCSVKVNIKEKLTLRDYEYDSPVNSTTIITCVCGTESTESQGKVIDDEWQKFSLQWM